MLAINDFPADCHLAFTSFSEFAHRRASPRGDRGTNKSCVCFLDGEVAPSAREPSTLVPTNTEEFMLEKTVVDQTPFGRWWIRDRNSVRVSSSLRKQPSIDEVTAAECCFSTPRIIMQRCRASTTTPTPCGWIIF